MMPTCEYKRCDRVAVVSIGEVKTAGDLHKKPVRGITPWQQVCYVCIPHYEKIMLLLGRHKTCVKSDVKYLKRRESEETL